MKILLMRPDSGIYTVLPPIGLMALAAYFRENSKHETEIYDGREKCAVDEDIIRKIREFVPDVLGLSVLTMERTEGHHTAKLIKKHFPDLPVVMGGPYVTSEAEDALQNAAIDYLVIGEGEIAGLNLFNALEKGEDPAGIKGVVFKRNGNLISTGMDEPVQDLDTLPMVAWDMIDLERYLHNPDRPTPMNLHVKTQRSAPILTTRGCPYQCTYCHRLFGKKLRKRSVEKVIEEIRYLKELNKIEEIEIIDDVFNLDNKWAMDFAGRVIEEKFNLYFSFPNGLRADRMPDDLIDRLVEMGTYRIVYAIESGSPQIQKEMRKKLDLEKARRAVNYTATKKISVGGFFILGFLNETEEQMKMTIDYALKNKFSTASFFMLTPFPNTEIFDQAVAAGYSLGDYSLTHYYALGHNISAVSDSRISNLHKNAYRRFYLHPGRLLRFFRTTPWHHYFWRKVWIAMLFFFYSFKPEKKEETLEKSSSGSWKRGKYS